MKEPTALSHFRQRLSWDDLDKDAIRKLVRLAAEEDLYGKGLKNEATQTGDQTTISMGVSGQGSAAIVAREPLVVCGLPMIPLILKEFEVEDAAIENSKVDGDEVEVGQTLAFISGAAVDLLAAERTLLNFIQRLSGVATFQFAGVGKVEGGVATFQFAFKSESCRSAADFPISGELESCRATFGFPLPDGSEGGKAAHWRRQGQTAGLGAAEIGRGTRPAVDRNLRGAA